MSTMDKINDLNNRRHEIEQGGKNSGINKARERINFLVDPDSFVEVGAFVRHRSTNFNMVDKSAPADGVITGYGTVNGRLVYVYSQDASVLGGSLGEMHAKKIGNIYDLAMKMGAPIIGILDSAGIRLQESTDGLQGYGEIFLKQTVASGVIPQITVILGDCAGGASIIPNLSDFTFMNKEKAKLFVNSPNTMEKATEFDDIGSAKIHSEQTGIVDFVSANEGDCFTNVRLLVDMLPANNMEDAPVYELSDDLNRVSDVLNEQDIDCFTIINEIADNNIFLELKKDFGTAAITGFIRVNGITVGVVANKNNVLNIDACEKSAAFVNICDAYNIPVLTLTDVVGYEAAIAQEQKGLSKAIAKLTYAFANATCPKVNVIIREAFGSAYVAMNSKHIGADIAYAWPHAKISVMNADSAVRIMYAEEIKASDAANEVIREKMQEFDELQASPYAAASRGYIDDVIEPASTRKRVIVALEMLISKREQRPAKKHSTML
nr:carboxyl transferase domain-containing protein [Vallitalea okinawensis]